MFEYSKSVFMCTTCSLTQDSMHKIMQHQREDHGGLVQPEKFEMKVYMCSACETHYGSVENCRRHELAKHSKKTATPVAKSPSFLNIDNDNESASNDVGEPIGLDDTPQESHLSTPVATATAPTTSTSADSSPSPNKDNQSPRGDLPGDVELSSVAPPLMKKARLTELGCNARDSDSPMMKKKLKSSPAKSPSTSSPYNVCLGDSCKLLSDQSAPLVPPTRQMKLNNRLAHCNAEMFKDMVFVLTLSANNEEDNKESQPFVRHEVIYMIRALGGEVVKYVGVDDDDTKNALFAGRAYCISDTYYGTVKYLTCLAAGAILISHKWILDSVAMGKVLPYDDYLLPAGADYDLGAQVKQIIRNPMSRRGSPLGNVRIVMDNGRSPLYAKTKKILAATGGAHILETPEERDTRTAQVYAVVDDDTKSEFMERCRAKDIPLLTPQWLVACLIHNKLIDPAENPRFTFTQNK